MVRRLAFTTLLLASLAHAGPRRVYVVDATRSSDASPEGRALVEQLDRRLRDELRRCGATVADGRSAPFAVVLSPRLEVLPGGLRLSLVGQRGADAKLLGTSTTRASGSSRHAQLRAVLSRVCAEASQLE